MTFLRYSPVAGAAAAVFAIACSSNSPAIPQAYVNAVVDDGANAANICMVEPSEGGFFTLGSASGVKADGDSQNGQAVTVECTVHANSDGTFNVDANAVVDGPNGGSITVSAPKWTKPPGMVTGVRGVFQNGELGTYTEADCTVSYSANSQMGVAAGRVWGTITCPTAVDTSIPIPGTTPPMDRTCRGTAEFKFENCGE